MADASQDADPAPSSPTRRSATPDAPGRTEAAGVPRGRTGIAPTGDGAVRGAAARRHLLRLACVLAIYLALAVALRFVQDDAFISFRYARNLVAGHGLAWQPGDPVFGYTNLLWTLLIAGALALGAPAEGAALSLGLAFGLATMAATAAIAWRTEREPWARLAAPAMLAVSHSFLRYATGGLETSLQAACLAGAMLALHRATGLEGRPRDLALLSLALGLAGLTRLDSAIFVATLGGAAAIHALRLPLGRRAAALGALAWPGAACLAVYAAITLAAHGTLLPNTLAAKTGGDPGLTLTFGAHFLKGYFLRSGHGLLLAAIAAGLPAIRRSPFHLALLASVTLWCAYVLSVGGDFMEYRFMIAPAPALALLAAHAFGALPARIGARTRGAILAAALGFVAAKSAIHGATFRNTYNVESIPVLAAHLDAPDENWRGMGAALGALFPQGYAGGPTLAVTAAGAIPDLSGLPTVDMLGLNDAWIARHGATAIRVGHGRMATADDLVARNVALVLGHPVNLPAGADAGALDAGRFIASLPVAPPSAGTLARLRAARVVTLPLPEGRRLAMLHLAPHPAVEAALAEGKLTDAGPVRLPDDLRARP